MRGFHQLFLLVVLSACCWGPAPGAEIGPIAIESSAREIAALVEVDGCKASLEWIRPEQVLRYRNDCGMPPAGKLQIFSALAEKLAAEHAVFKTARTLAVGRLSVTFPEWAREISLAASKLPKWDAKRGRAARSGQFDFGADNAFFRETANELKLFEPLAEALKPYRVVPRVASVEKVLAAPPRQTPFGDWLTEQGVPADAKLPFDAQTWLYLEHGGGSK